MGEDVLIFIYLLILMSGLGVLVIYSEIRSRKFGPSASQDHVFRCVQCGLVYTDDADVDRSRCSQCGTMNDVIEF